MGSDAGRFLGTLPIFSDLTPSEVEELAWAARPFRLEAGDFLFHQGAPANEVCCVERGRLVLTVRVGGSEQRRIGVLNAGSIVGEAALVDRALRSASAVAAEPTSGYALHHRAFDVLRATYRPSALKVLRRIAGLISARLAGAVPSHVGRSHAGGLVDLGQYRHPATDLDRENLRRLPALGEFEPDELSVLLESSHQLVLPKGTILFHEGDPPGSCFITVRGAAELFVEDAGRRQKLALRGPGKMFGEAGLFSDRHRAATGWVRENSVLLELERAAFDRLFSDEPVVAGKFLESAIQLLIDLMRSAAVRQAWFEAERGVVHA
jgi:CRP/FNR family transcriptional regulator, cyclic AMP receptor protein